MLKRLPNAVASLCAAVGILMLASLDVRAGVGDYETTNPPYINAPRPGPKSYFVEFRGRNEVGGFGHSYVTLGTADAAGHWQRTAIFGFMPKDEDGNFWAQIAVPVSGWIGVTQSDFTTSPDVRFRRKISRAQYKQITSEIQDLQKTWTIYLLLVHNCNDLVAHVAQSIGLNVPLLSAQWPVDYVEELKSINTPL